MPRSNGPSVHSATSQRLRDGEDFIVLRPEYTESRTLVDLAARLGAECPTADRTVLSGVTVSTSDVRPGDLYVGLSGAHIHGALTASAAARDGAVALLTDPEGARLARGCGLPVLTVDDPRAVVGQVAAWLYGTAEADVSLFGVTGTNGKTSTVHILDSLLTRLGIPSGLSSTVERRTGLEAVPSRLTTPEASELHALVARMTETGVRGAAVEVSAQAMSRNRVGGLIFDVVGFTNLTHDHLDEYSGMTAYLRAKAALFQPQHARRGVVSLDSPWGEEVVRRAGIPCTTISSHADSGADWIVSFGIEAPELTAFTVTGPGGQILRSRVTLTGRHMAANAALALVMLLESGVPFTSVEEAVGDGIAVEIPGRVARVPTRSGPKVFVDIAHTPDAFATTLAAVRRVTAGSVLMIIGADGDRDATKRSEMGRLAAEGSDVLIVTDHHSRFEDEAAIRAQLIAGAQRAACSAVLHEIPDPAEAIRRAVQLAGEQDSVLWVGPGLTEYRDVRGAHWPYSSYRDALAALREAGWR